ncbi:MAG: hypothetical protein ACJ72H_20395 [Candidatus Sulfotelmatobacter sp.]
MTLAPAWPQAIPSLAKVPAHYSHEVNGELLYKLCAALTAKGFGSPETWVKCGRDCVAFARYSIMSAIGSERGELLRRNVEWRLEISDTLSDGYFTDESDPPVEQGKLCVTASCNGCGYLRIGAALDALEREAAGLGAAFYWSLVHALYRVMRIYDHDDALMYEEQLRDYINEDDTANPDEYEFPEVKKALPAYIEQTLDTKWTVAGQRLLASRANGPHGSWIRRLGALNRLARVKVATDGEAVRGNYDGPPLPALVLAFRDQDAIVACFDEESQHMLEASSEPTLCVVFAPDNRAESERACAAVRRFVAFNVELFTLVEEIGVGEVGHGREHSDRADASLRAA